MRKLYAICYMFNRPDPQQYEAFFEQLQTFGPWCHYIEGTWLVASVLSADEINHKLSDFLDNNIYLLIMEVGQDFSGWLPEKAWDWIKSQQVEMNGSASYNHATATV